MTKTVLLVDDSATMIMSVKALLTTNGFAAVTASNGRQALAEIKKAKPDLIITDINMPDMNGLELIQQVRQLPGMRFVPILTLTTESDSSKRDDAKKLGATGWLVKPVSGVDLVNVIKRVVPGA